MFSFESDPQSRYYLRIDTLFLPFYWLHVAIDKKLTTPRICFPFLSPNFKTENKIKVDIFYSCFFLWYFLIKADNTKGKTHYFLQLLPVMIKIPLQLLVSCKKFYIWVCFNNHSSFPPDQYNLQSICILIFKSVSLIHIYIIIQYNKFIFESAPLKSILERPSIMD